MKWGIRTRKTFSRSSGNGSKHVVNMISLEQGTVLQAVKLIHHILMTALT